MDTRTTRPCSSCSKQVHLTRAYDPVETSTWLAVSIEETKYLADLYNWARDMVSYTGRQMPLDHNRMSNIKSKKDAIDQGYMSLFTLLAGV